MHRRLAPYPGMSHPDIGITADIALEGSVLALVYQVSGALDELRIPSSGLARRADGLWQETCFEAFLDLGNGYLEFNFAPSKAWAAYRFDDYRTGVNQAGRGPAPVIQVKTTRNSLIADVSLDLTHFAAEQPSRMGLCAVIEEKSGRKSYWALTHPPGKPDFHHPDCFALELPAASKA